MKSYFFTSEIDNRYIVFSNGVLDLVNKTFSDHNPKYFTTHKMVYPYDPLAKDTPVFLKFIEDFWSGYNDRIAYLRSMLNAVVCSKITYQVIFYIFGPGAPGKFQLPTLLIALIGEQSGVSTTLNALSNDQYEVVNLVGKKLVLINETSDIMKDLTRVKRYSGLDSFRGRRMNIQGRIEVRPEGVLVGVGNSPLEIQDTGNAMVRRLRSFKTRIPSNSRSPLISRTGFHNWERPLKKELSGILNWVLDIEDKQVDNYITRTEENVLSLKSSFQQSKLSMNSVLKWVEQEGTSIDGETFIGWYSLEKKQQGATKGVFLYPPYLTWCKRYKENPVDQTKFSHQVLEA